MTGLGQVAQADAGTRLSGLKPYLRQRVIGQDEVIAALGTGLELKCAGST